jgi:hypothetical protein
MMEAAPLLLTAPWRMFFDRNRNIDTASAFYNDLKQAFLARHANEFLHEEYERWDASQEDGHIYFAKQGDLNCRAAFQIIGTLFNGSFMWGDVNPSLQAGLTQDASKFRKIAKERGYPIVDQDKFLSSQRDAVALLALCTSMLNSQAWCAARSGQTFILMTLSNFEQTLGDHEFQEPLPETRSWSPFKQLSDLINAQIARVQPEEHELFQTEAEFERAYQAYKTGDYSLALEVIAGTKTRLGAHLVDKEPSGWMFLCEGATLLQLGKKEEARKAFDQSGQCVLIPDSVIRFIGLSRAVETEDAKQDYLSAAYIRNPDRFIALATPQEQAQVSVLLSKAWEEKPAQDTAKEAWAAVLNAYQNLEKDAYARSQEAAKHRKERHQLCDEDIAARNQTDRNWRRFCLTWMTPGRSPWMSSYGSDPDHCPETAEILDIQTPDENSCIISTQRNKGIVLRFRYEMVKFSPPLAEETRWLLNRVWSVWDDEEILLFE